MTANVPIPKVEYVLFDMDGLLMWVERAQSGKTS
jgi:hypothetical protein